MTPASTRNKVLFPAPLWPTRPWISPGSTARETRSRTVRSPNTFVTSIASSPLLESVSTVRRLAVSLVLADFARCGLPVSNDCKRSKDLFRNFLAVQIIFDLLQGDLRVLIRFLSSRRRILRLDGKLRDSESVHLGIRVQTFYRTECSLSGWPCVCPDQVNVRVGLEHLSGFLEADVWLDQPVHFLDNFHVRIAGKH